MVKVDIIIEQQELRDVQIKCTLNPVKQMDDTLIYYDAEVKVGPMVIGIDEICQLDEIIEQLTDFRKMWGRSEDQLTHEFKEALARNYKK